ncbi:MAG: outer membrane protein assembly factor BamA [Flavobacteriaceae bacterium]|jgi:outer membrane protein assembly factor BamA
MNNKNLIRFSLFWKIMTLLLLFFSGPTFSQSNNDSIPRCPVKSLPELFKKKDSILTFKPIKNDLFLVIPVIGSSPATGFLFGAITQYTFKGDQAKDKYSTFNIGATYTTNGQLLVNSKNTLLLNSNKIYLNGDWRYYIFSQDNYGLGSDIIPRANDDDGFVLDALSQPMDYDYFKFHQTVSFRIVSDFYIGGGLHVDGYTNISDKLLDLPNNKLTEHYKYNERYRFSTNEYYVNGLSLNFVFDSRDNQVNANNGWYGNINFRTNRSFRNNQASSSVLFAEFKYYIPLSKTNVQHVLAFWTYGQFLTLGDLPYLNLPALGWDKTSRASRGYVQGLIRGQNLAYIETEYRFPISCNQLVSGAVFANLITASDKDRHIKLFDAVQPAFGVGLRILIDKSTRTNLVFNQAWGRHSKAFYLNAGETF